MLDVASRLILIAAVVVFVGAGEWLVAEEQRLAVWFAGSALGLFTSAALLDGLRRIAEAFKNIARRLNRFTAE